MQVDRRPRLTEAAAAQLARRHFGVVGPVRELAGERDYNARVGDAVLKVAHPAEDPAFLDAQHGALDRLSSTGVTPTVLPSVDGVPRVRVELDGVTHWLRMLRWLPGTPLADAGPPSEALSRDIGGVLGRLDRALEGYAPAALRRALVWDSPAVRATLAAHLPALAPDTRGLVERTLTAVGPTLDAAPELPAGVIHNDANDHNLLVEGDRLVGLIDFGDMLWSPRVCELAVAGAYLMMGAADPLSRLAPLVAGYERACPLSRDERACLLDWVRVRLCLSVTLAASQRRRAPENAYLSVSEAPARALLRRLETA